MSIGNSPEILSQAMLVGMIVVGKLGRINGDSEAADKAPTNYCLSHNWSVVFERGQSSTLNITDIYTEVTPRPRQSSAFQAYGAPKPSEGTPKQRRSGA